MAARILRSLLGVFGYTVERGSSYAPPFAVEIIGWRLISLRPKKRTAYINCAETIAAARSQGCTVPEYVAALWSESGVVDACVRRIANFVLELPPDPKIVEIGPGTGRFLESWMKILKPKLYEIYEIDEEWAQYLSETYGTQRCITNGNSLGGTTTASCDLVLAHYVFVYLSLRTAFQYFAEMTRVVRPGGFIAFDVYLADKFDRENIAAFQSSADHQWGVILPRSGLVEFFAAAGCNLVGEFRMKAFLGHSDYLIFQKTEIND